jgi:hypothetical protein
MFTFVIQAEPDKNFDALVQKDPTYYHAGYVGSLAMMTARLSFNWVSPLAGRNAKGHLVVLLTFGSWLRK